jgi:hypothetical protein
MSQLRNGAQQGYDGQCLSGQKYQDSKREVRNVDNGRNLVSENVTVELQDRHPASGAHMDGANDDNTAGLDGLANAPHRVRTPRI